MLFNAKRTGNEGGTTADIFLQNGMKVDMALRPSIILSWPYAWKYCTNLAGDSYRSRDKALIMEDKRESELQ
jgi:hypothetical protein